MQSLVAQGAAHPTARTSEPYRGSVVHLDDGATKTMNHEIDDPSCWPRADLWGSGFAAQPEFIPQELTSVSVHQPMSLDDPYSAVDGCSAPSEIIVELADSQQSGGLGIEAYRPRVAKSKPPPTATTDRRQRTRGLHPSKNLTTASVAASSAKHHRQFVPCNTSQALDITDLSTDASTSNSLRAPFKSSNASIRLAYFKHKKPVSERILSASGPEPAATYFDSNLRRSSHFKSSRVTLNNQSDVSYITMTMPYMRHVSAPRSPRAASREKPPGLSVRGRTLSYREQITPTRKGRALKEADLLKITALHGESVKNPLNYELLSLTHPFSNHPLYRSALYTGDVRNLYIQGGASRDYVGSRDYDSRYLQRLMRPTISSAGKVSTYAEYLHCTDLVKNLPLESDDYAHPDNNISSYVDYRIDTQLHLGADKVPLPANSMSTTDRILNKLLAEQAEERNAHMRFLSRSGQRRPKSAPLQVSTGDNMGSQARRPRSAILAFLSEAQTVETTIYREKPSMSPEQDKRATSRDFQEEYSTEVTLSDSFPPLIKRNSFLPTPSPKNHILAIKKSNLYKHRRKCDYAGEECSSMDQFSGELGLQKRPQSKKRLKSATPPDAKLQLSGQPTGKEITTPSSARPSQKRLTPMETNNYGSVISPQLSTDTACLRQISPCKDYQKNNNAHARSRGANKKKQTTERIRQLTSPEHMQDICIKDKNGDYAKWSSRLESPQIAPIQVVIRESQRHAVSDPRPWSSSHKKCADDTIFDTDLIRPQSADLSRNYERSITKRLSGTVHSQSITDLPSQVATTTPAFIPSMPILHQPKSPDRLWKEQEATTERKTVQETRMSTERRSTVASYTTNFSNLTGLTSKTGSSCRSATFLQGYSRGRAHYFSSHPANSRSQQQYGSVVIGRGASTVQVPYGGLVSPHKNCFLAQIDEEERFAYASGQYADPTGLARSIQLATNLGGRSLK